MIAPYVEKIKSWVADNKADLFVAAVIFLVGISSFGLGRLSVLWLEKEPIEIKNYETGGRNYEEAAAAIPDNNGPNSKSLIPNSSAKYVVSKAGTRYHFPWCPGAQRIKETNKIWFETKEEAEKAGYKPAANCPGL